MRPAATATARLPLYNHNHQGAKDTMGHKGNLGVRFVLLRVPCGFEARS